MVSGNLAHLSNKQAVRSDSGRYAVIDVGSNSIRLVIFDRLTRGLSVMFNEKVLCGLGSNINVTGRLNEEGIHQALTNLRRFSILIREMDVQSLDAVATAAVRDAQDGAAFLKRVYDECNLELRVLSGQDECRYTAYGVLSSISGANGLVGDLGGGSLELAQLSHGSVSNSYTLPLGPLRLRAQETQNDKPCLSRIDSVFDDIVQTPMESKAVLYLVGGNWRALGRLHMSQSSYPLRVVHQYTMTYKEIYDFALLISKQSPKSLNGVSDISKKRIELIPIAASVLLMLLGKIRPKKIVFCGTGLREGLAYSRLATREKVQDPLISVCRDLACRVARFPNHGDELSSWIGSIFENESNDEVRLRHATCLLSDIAWRIHPDYRAEYALMEALWLQAAIDHRGRTFLGLATMYRYSSKKVPKLANDVGRLLDENVLHRARAVGLAARVGETICGGVPGVLHRFSLLKNGNRLFLRCQKDDSSMIGYVVRARFQALARHLSLMPCIENVSLQNN